MPGWRVDRDEMEKLAEKHADFLKSFPREEFTMSDTTQRLEERRSRVPERIYLQTGCGEPECDECLGHDLDFDGMTWCVDKIHCDDTEYVRADEIARLTAELEDQRERTRRAAGDAWDFGEMARELRAERDALRQAMLLLCGRYEGHCENYFRSDCWQNGRTADAEHAAYQACSLCVLTRALNPEDFVAPNPEGADHD